MAMLLACLFAALQASSASAHAGHGHHDGRVPGQPDFKRIGNTTYRFKPGLEEYEIRRPETPPALAHVDYDEVSAFAEGGWVDLPSQELAPVCRTSGNRIVVVYSHRPSETGPAPAESLRSIVRRMSWKVNQQGSISSGGGRTVNMAVDCTAGGTIQVHDVTSVNSDFSTVFSAASAQLFGSPTGTDAVKYLIFEHDEKGTLPGTGDVGGLGERRKDEDKEYANVNAYISAHAIIYGAGWETHVTLHELFHALGASQGDGEHPAPFSTEGSHCIDGIDVLCYNDHTKSSTYATYDDYRCPSWEGYDQPEKDPLDCGYDTYFNTAPSSGSWLASYWNTAGEEDPYLVNGTDIRLIAKNGEVSQSSLEKATLHGTVYGQGVLATTYRFEYGTTTSYGSATPSTSVAGDLQGKAVENTISGLTPGATYHYRLAASNSNGTVYSADSSFKASLWTPVSVPGSGSSNRLEGVSCVGRGDCTAVGMANHETLVDHWDGQKWSTESAPNPSGAYESALRDVSCTSTSFCMAVGSTGEYLPYSGRPLALYRNGGAWSEVAVPSPGDASELVALSSVSCSSSTACVAVGEYDAVTVEETEEEPAQIERRTLAVSWDGSKWTAMPSPGLSEGATQGGVKDVSCSAANACTAVGGATYPPYEFRRTLAERWNGTEWTVQATASRPGYYNELEGVSCGSANACVAVGRDEVGKFIAESWNGAKWQADSTANLGYASPAAVSCQASGVCVASSSRLAAIRESGTWSVDPIIESAGNQEIADVSCWSASSCVAVGLRPESGKVLALAEHRSPLVAPSAETTAATSVKGLTATLNATVDPNGYSTAYQFEYGPTASYGSKAPASTKAVGSGTGEVQIAQPVTGLKPLSTYHYRVVASNGAGQAFGKDMTLSTATDLPSASLETASGVTVTKATLNASLNPNGLETTYQFEYGKTTSYGSKAPVSAKSIGSGTSAVKASEAITGLTGGTTYHYRVAATNSLGTTNSADGTFTTLPSATMSYSLSFGKSGNGNGQFAYPRGVAVDGAGNVYVDDLLHGYIQKFNAKGEYLSKFEVYGEVGFGSLVGLDVDSKGNIWIANSSSLTVQQLSPTGALLQEVEVQSTPSDIAVDSKDGIWVAEPEANAHQVSHYNSSGEFVTAISEGGSGAGKLKEPSYIAVDAEDDLWVAERGNKRVQKFSSAGKYLSQFGSAGSTDGKFEDPSGIDVGPDGTVWVSDMATNRIQAFSPAGAFQAKFGSAGTGPGQFGGLCLPTSSLAVGSDGTVWAVDGWNQRVQKWVRSE